MKNAVDTNVLLRALVVDDSAQSAQAIEIILQTEVFVATTVVLELEWILRSVLKLDREQINAILRRLMGLENVEFESAFVVSNAIMAHERGMDFADALHLHATKAGCSFLTFDVRLSKKAKQLDSAPTTVLVSLASGGAR